jgi:(p)ppGpp synthase/HD superfamily hydrolase
MTIVVDDIEHLQVIIANLRKINNVIDVERVIK